MLGNVPVAGLEPAKAFRPLGLQPRPFAATVTPACGEPRFADGKTSSVFLLYFSAHFTVWQRRVGGLNSHGREPQPFSKRWPTPTFGWTLPSCTQLVQPLHGWQDSNLQPAVLETAALPFELHPYKHGTPCFSLPTKVAPAALHILRHHFGVCAHTIYLRQPGLSGRLTCDLPFLSHT